LIDGLTDEDIGALTGRVRDQEFLRIFFLRRRKEKRGEVTPEALEEDEDEDEDDEEEGDL
jgi:hypothetical protein